MLAIVLNCFKLDRKQTVSTISIKAVSSTLSIVIWQQAVVDGQLFNGTIIYLLLQNNCVHYSRRTNGQTSFFNRTDNEYTQTGFGDVAADHWQPLDLISMLSNTSNGNVTWRFEVIQSFNCTKIVEWLRSAVIDAHRCNVHYNWILTELKNTSWV